MKKIWLVIAIALSFEALLLGIGAFLAYNESPDASAFVEDITYNEGIVKETKASTNRKSDIIAYNIYVEGDNNLELIIKPEAIEDQSLIDNLKSGDKIVFGLSPKQQVNLDNKDKEYVLLTPVYISCNDKVIVSLESYQGQIIHDIGISNKLILGVAIAHLCLGVISFVIFFSQRKRVLCAKKAD